MSDIDMEDDKPKVNYAPCFHKAHPVSPARTRNYQAPPDPFPPAPFSPAPAAPTLFLPAHVPPAPDPAPGDYHLENHRDWSRSWQRHRERRGGGELYQVRHFTS